MQGRSHRLHGRESFPIHFANPLSFPTHRGPAAAPQLPARRAGAKEPDSNRKGPLSGSISAGTPPGKFLLQSLYSRITLIGTRRKTGR